MDKMPRWLAPLGLAGMMALASGNCLAQGPAGAPQWLTGQDLLRRREQVVGLTWTGVPLRDGLANLSRAQRVAILLDRRIDPEQRIDLPAERVPLDEVLERVGASVKAGVCWLGPVAYIGPRDAAYRLRTIAALRAADVRALPKEKRAAFQRDAAWRWEVLAEPRGLAAELAVAAKVSIESLDLIGHDLWPATDLPPLSWTDRLTLIANEFDLTFEIIDSAHVRLIPITESISIERSYPGGKQPDELAAKWRTLAPGAEVAVARGKIVVRGRLEDHERLTQTKKPKPTSTTPGVEVYSLRVQQEPISAVLDALRKQSSINLLVDEAAIKKANLSLDTRVSFSVEQVKFEELLAAALKPAGLTFRREGSTYRIVPAAQ